MWGAVCDDTWDSSDADVTCRQLGFSPGGKYVQEILFRLLLMHSMKTDSPTGATAFIFAFFGQGTGPIWLDNVTCTGNETRLYDCRNSGISIHNCSHHEDAGVRCQSKQPPWITFLL